MSDKFLLSRRSFLKALGVTGLALTVNPFELFQSKAHPHFNPKKEYGDYLCITDFVNGQNDPIVREAINIMDEQIHKTIPLKFRKHIEFLFKNAKPTKSDPLAQVGFSYWKYKPGGKGGLRFE